MEFNGGSGVDWLGSATRSVAAHCISIGIVLMLATLFAPAMRSKTERRWLSYGVFMTARAKKVQTLLLPSMPEGGTGAVMGLGCEHGCCDCAVTVL